MPQKDGKTQPTAQRILDSVQALDRKVKLLGCHIAGRDLFVRAVSQQKAISAGQRIHQGPQDCVTPLRDLRQALKRGET